jgi:competence protein ComEC
MVFGEDRRARAKAWAAGIDTARRRAGLAVPEPALLWLRGTLSGWLAAEVAPGRLFPWLPVAFGFGIVLYFTADREPVWWVACATAAGATALAVAAHRRAVLFPLLLGVAAIAAGFAVASGKRALIAHPVLQKQTYAREVSGFVETREERARSDRIVVRVSHLDAYRLKEPPERVRVAVRKGTAPAVGDHVTFKARLSPPLPPLRPGGYDFARDKDSAPGKPVFNRTVGLRDSYAKIAG